MTLFVATYSLSADPCDAKARGIELHQNANCVQFVSSFPEVKTQFVQLFTGRPEPE